MANRFLRASTIIGTFFLAPTVGIVAQQSVQPGPTARWSLAAVGDAIITRRIAQFDHAGDPGFADMVDVIQGADAAMVNLEISLFRLTSFQGWPEVENGGNWEIGPPEAAQDLKDLGFDFFNRANNHTTDYGVAGMVATDTLLDRLEIVHAGSGPNLAWASRPGYFESRRGRVAFIGLATSFTPMSRAGASRPEYLGRPGLNALRVNTRYEGDPTTMSTLAGVAPSLGGRAPGEGGGPVRVGGITVYPGERTQVVETLEAADSARILREVRNAADQADFVVVNSHSHQPGNEVLTPPEWMVGWARACIDAGAVAYIVHGPHQLRGIEIYKGRPIFYSLGNFVFQNETIDPMPADNYESFDLPSTALAKDLYDARFRNGTIGFPADPIWYESVVAVPTFQGKELVELRLYPIDLGQKMPRSQRGTPRLADAETGRTIIARLAELSAPFGTDIRYENGIGVWRR